jgi:hypothetical protein
VPLRLTVSEVVTKPSTGLSITGGLGAANAALTDPKSARKKTETAPKPIAREDRIKTTRELTVSRTH